MAPFPFLLLLLLPSPVILAAGPDCASQLKAFSKVRQPYSDCRPLPALSASLHWTHNATNSTLSFAFLASPPDSSGWVSWGINPTAAAMAGTQALAAYHRSDGSLAAATLNIAGYGPVSPSPISFESWGLEAEKGAGGVLGVFATLKLPDGLTSFNQVWQVGPPAVGGGIGKHEFGPDNINAVGELDVAGNHHGQVEEGLSSAPNFHGWNTHGILNAISWGFLFPVGIMAARWLKFKDPTWFYVHVSCQVTGFILGTAGWFYGWSLARGRSSAGGHGKIGNILFALATIQVIVALLLRPKKDHKLRKFWDAFHHVAGYAIVVLSFFNVFTGLLRLRPGWTNGYFAVFGVLIVAMIVLEVGFGRLAPKGKSEDIEKFQNASPASGGQPQEAERPLSL